MEAEVKSHPHELELLAAFVHGALAFGHLLGFVYNVRKGNKLDAGVHGFAAAYDVYATAKHARRIR